PPDRDASSSPGRPVAGARGRRAAGRRTGAATLEGSATGSMLPRLGRFLGGGAARGRRRGARPGKAARFSAVAGRQPRKGDLHDGRVSAPLSPVLAVRVRRAGPAVSNRPD